MKAIVTGASSGIGATTVRELSAANYEVLAIARRQDRLAELEDRHNIRTVSADVRDIARLEREFEDFAPDLLINNAGVGHGIAGLSNLDPKIVQEAIDINITALVQLTGAVLPGMLNRGRGHIVNIGSISGTQTAEAPCVRYGRKPFEF
ncbi:MAG: SDR family NAD(P)-dependent oxidoreductase, partial [Rhodobacteraceae bacterium]|nr:SDR family NAD(P)-dependent oxidoreductase [Paracoccaceae bacterium]